MVDYFTPSYTRVQTLEGPGEIYASAFNRCLVWLDADDQGCRTVVPFSYDQLELEAKGD